MLQNGSLKSNAYMQSTRLAAEAAKDTTSDERAADTGGPVSTPCQNTTFESTEILRRIAKFDSNSIASVVSCACMVGKMTSEEHFTTNIVVDVAMLAKGKLHLSISNCKHVGCVGHA